MEERIFALVQTLSGEQGAQEEAVLGLCRATEGALRARLRAGVTAEDCGEAFVTACAWYVLAALRDCAAAEGITAFTAGDLTVKKDGADSTGRLRMQADTLLWPYLADGFAFLGVRG